MRNIAVATDFAEGGRLALARAAQLALEHDARLTLLHVWGEPAIEVARMMFGADGPEINEALKKSIEEQARAAVEDLAPGLQDRTTVRVLSGRPDREILAAIREDGIDVVVMGAQSQRPRMGLWFGSTTERVMLNADRPTLAVKREPSGPYRRLLVPVDFSANSGAALELAMRFSPDAEITALHAYHVPFESKLRLSGATEDAIEGYRENALNEAKKGMAALVANTPGARGRVKTALVEGSAALVVMEQEKLLESDLIVVSRQGHSMIGEVLLGRVTRRVLIDSGADVLISCVRSK